MKKTLIVVALATALVFAFAAVAMARPNGNIYIAWTSAAPNDAPATPHAGYTTATEKCNVCHSVHYAATSGFAWDGAAGTSTVAAQAWTADTSNTQMLLRSSVANACNYCHIQTTIGGVRLYGGEVAAYTTNSAFAHNSSSAKCSGCHAVHGANTFQGANLSKILRVRSDRPIQPEVIGSAGANTNIDVLFADANASGDGQDEAIAYSADKYLQQVAFCTQCHAEYTDAAEETITGAPGYFTNDDGTYPSADDYTGEYKGHPMKAADASWDNTAAGGSFMGQVAWEKSSTCRDCHDAGLVDQTGTTWNSFPHYTQGYYVFSTRGASMDNTAAAANDVDYATDGNCLKCHVNAGSTAGVGITY